MSHVTIRVTTKICVSWLRATSGACQWQVVIALEMASTDTEKLEFIVRMTRSAWNAYVHHAWPHDMLRPVTENAFQGWFGPNSGETIVNALSTLWVMGLEDEYRLGMRWVTSEM